MKSNWVVLAATLWMSGASFAVDGDYLSNFDLVWDRVPKAYEESAFLGNGELGTAIWSARDEALHFDIGDTRVYSEKSRAPIGKFILKTQGQTTGFDMRLDLHKALASGTIKTDVGSVRFESLASLKQDAVLVEFVVEGGEQIGIEHFALPGAPTDALYANHKTAELEHAEQNDFTHPKTYAALMGMDLVKHLQPEECGETDGVNWRFVPLKGGQKYVLTWKLEEVEPGRYLLAWTTDYAQKAGTLSKKGGVQGIKEAFSAGLDQIKKDHFEHWANYFSKPFLSLPDKRIEANYWAQMYKYGSATRPGALPIDLMGPWHRATPWPRIWANLNVQLQYLPMPVANQPGIASTLADWIDANNDIFINAAGEFSADSASCGRGTSPYGPTGFWGEYGNFLWTLYDYWHFLRVYPDDERMVEKFYPILKRANNYCVHALSEGDEGKLHMPKDTSPEWKIKGEDTTYNLETLRWGLETAIYIGEHFDLNDRDTARYKDILGKLVEKHVDKKGVIMLGKELHLTGPHRHYSHLVGLYPLRRIDIDNPQEHALYLKTVDHWLGFPHPYPITRHAWFYKGYTRTGATPMYAMLDQPEKALNQFKQYFDLYLYPNTFYLETGPVIETPLSSAAATQELLLQSWGLDNYATDLVRLFPGIASEWPEVRFDQLRAEGGYTVSAVCKDGKTTAFSVTADRDSSLQLRYKAASDTEPETTQGSPIEMNVSKGWNILSVDLKQGESLWFGDQSGFKTAVVDVETDRHDFHFGMNDPFLSTYTPD